MALLVLWDVDGTLLSAPGIGMAAMHRAIERVVGRRPTTSVRYAGLLDPDIVRRQLTAMGLEVGDQVEAILTASVDELEAAKAEIAEKGYPMPGVPDILERLAAHPGVLQTVLTGNLRANAVLKLATLGIDRWLDLEVGAYGEDAEVRADLVAVALRRATEHRGMTFDRQQVWVIGDTEHDLACAHGGGARCLLVRTGWEALDDEIASRADAVVDDLTDPGVLDLLLGPVSAEPG